jgi:NAD(P)H-nitrite reductase large subunit
VTKSEPLLCRCFKVPERVVREAIAAGAVTVDQVRALTQASSGCGSCYDDIQALLGAPVPPSPVLTGGDTRAVVRKVIDEFQRDDVKIEFEAMDGATVRARVVTPDGDTRRADVLEIKRRLLARLSEELHARVKLLELNVLEEWERR